MESIGILAFISLNFYNSVFAVSKGNWLLGQLSLVVGKRCRLLGQLWRNGTGCATS